MHDSVVFKIFGLEVTNVIVASWVIMLLLVVFSILATRKMKDVPGVLQNIAEWAVEALQNFFGGILGQWRMRRYFPALATFFIFIVISNYSGLLPGIGHFKGYATPTANLSVTAALSLCAFVMIHGLGFKERGVGNYLKSFLKPFAVLLPLTLIAGWYGMNFTGMPLLEWRYGYPAVVAVSALVVALLIWYFKRKKWF